MTGSGRPIRLRIEDIAPGGLGVARAENRALLVRGGLPGDLVDAKVVRRERGRVEAVVTGRHSGRIERVAARCRHFGVCGGCAWQDLTYADQLELKTAIVRHAFREAGLAEGPVAEAAGSEEIYDYRNRMDFAFGRGESGGLTLGLHRAADAPGGPRGTAEAGRDDPPFRSTPVFDLEECWLQSRTSNRIVSRVRDFLKDREVPAYNPEFRSGLLRHLSIREGKATGEILVTVGVAAPEAAFIEPLADALMAEEPGLRGVVLSVNPKRSRNAATVSVRTVRGEGRITERLGDLEFEVSPTSFFQVNTRQAEQLALTVVRFAGMDGAGRVLDLYCGTGALTLSVARNAASAIGVEVSEAAVDDARRNTGRNGVRNCRFVCGDVLRILPGLGDAEGPVDLVTVNPPRAGIYRAVIQAICALRPRRVIYVSCNPETLARDIPRFWAGGYRLERVQPVDLFPHTPHCEVVAAMERI